MNAIDYGVSRIKQNIPRELIQMAMRQDSFYGAYQGYSLEALIRHRVIEEIVRTELDIVGGEFVQINLSNVPYKEIHSARVYNVPLSMTKGRAITRAHAIENGLPDMGASQSTNDLMLNAANGPQATGTAKVTVRPPNMIIVEEQTPGLNTFLSCILENDPEFNNINRSYYRDFGELCVLAAQMFINNELAIAIGEGAVNGGAPSPQLRSRIDSYEDAGTMFYEVIRDKWRRIYINNDPKMKRGIIRMQLGG